MLAQLQLYPRVLLQHPSRLISFVGYFRACPTLLSLGWLLVSQWAPLIPYASPTHLGFSWLVIKDSDFLRECFKELDLLEVIEVARQ